MPGEPPYDKPPHQVLRGQKTDRTGIWRCELKKATRATGCFDLFFPDLALECELEELYARHSQGTWQSLARRISHEAATHILSAFISGPMWAYLLIRWPNESLLDVPDEVVKMADEASLRFLAAPATDRERHKMLYELEHGNPGEYPSDKHFQDARDWLEVAVHLSTCKEAVDARMSGCISLSPLPVNREAGQGQSVAEAPNSSARRKRRRGVEGTPEGPERRRIKLEP